jgi:hypothetical protein
VRRKDGAAAYTEADAACPLRAQLPRKAMPLQSTRNGRVSPLASRISLFPGSDPVANALPKPLC